VGINGSPTCGVETTWSNNEEKPGTGIFIQVFGEELDRWDIFLRMKGIKAYEPERAVAAVLELLEMSPRNKNTAREGP
jgi:predicted secreted protein